MPTRFLALAILFAGAFPPVLIAEPDNAVAPDGFSFRGALPIEFIADGIPHPAPVESGQAAGAILPSLSLSAADGGGAAVEFGAPCVASGKQPWLETLLQRAVAWLSEPDCAPVEAPELLLVGDNDSSARPFPFYEHEAAQAYLSAYLKSNPRAFRLGYRRSGRYLPMIRRVFMAEGLPEELIYLPAVESNYNPRARSPVRAVGLWQFMVATARRFDLYVRYPWYDERLDPEKATQAAASLLIYLHDRYGNWELALAAYNAGEGRVNRAIREARSKGLEPHYWNLRLPPQTRAYVPALLAMVKLYRSPAAHGFVDMERDRPVRTETLQLSATSSLAEVAHRIKMPLPELVRLNPAWRRGYIPANLRDRVMLRLPLGRKEALLASLEKEDLSSLPWLTHTVERRETLSTIAKGYGVIMDDIVSVNHIPNRHFLSIGQKLIIPL